MKILNSDQIKLLDQETIAIQNISSWQLMERASEAVTDAILDKIKGQQPAFSIFCGKGNNGGDGLAIARILFRKISKSISFAPGRTIFQRKSGEPEKVKEYGYQRYSFQ